MSCYFWEPDRHILIENGSIANFDHIELGSNVYVGPHSYLFAIGGIGIGNNVYIGDHVLILTGEHNYGNASHLPFDGRVFLRKVSLSDNVIVEGNVSLGPGVSVGEGAVLRRGTAVTRDVPPLAVIEGNPARIVEYRDRARYGSLKAEGKPSQCVIPADRLRSLTEGMADRVVGAPRAPASRRRVILRSRSGGYIHIEFDDYQELNCIVNDLRHITTSAEVIPAKDGDSVRERECVERVGDKYPHSVFYFDPSWPDARAIDAYLMRGEKSVAGG